MSRTAVEHVLVVPTAELHGLGYFQGFAGDVQRYWPALLANENLSFRPRDEVEDDPGFKQLIPYVVFRHAPQGGPARLFSYTRGRGQGESRLHHKRSIGVGGHISSEDAGVAAEVPSAWRAAGVCGADLYAAGLRREIEEEVDLAGVGRTSHRVAGLINDDSTPVGQVHLGIVHLWDVERPAVLPREVELADAAFRSVAELLAERERFETWSQICMQALFA
jgi:predicted NUDIX family phosphoesterase